MVVKHDMEGWFIYTPDGERFPYSLENITKALSA